MATVASLRLTEYEIKAIKTAFTDIFGEGEIILFGSRVDPDARGGDIDLYLIPQNRENLRNKRINFLIKLDLLIGERKVDVIVAKDQNRPIEKEALLTGVTL